MYTYTHIIYNLLYSGIYNTHKTYNTYNACYTYNVYVIFIRS